MREAATRGCAVRSAGARSSAEPYRHELNTSTVAERIVGSTAFRVEQEQCRAGSDSLRYEGSDPRSGLVSTATSGNTSWERH